MKILRIALFAALIAASPAPAAQFVVTNTSSSGAGSLRDALDQAGASSARDTVTFDIPGAGPHVINDAGLLLLYPVLIDGMTQPGAVPNSNAGDAPWNGTIQIQVDGTGFPGQNVFDVGFPASELRGLAITGAEGGYAVRLSSNGGHKVASCFIGLDANGQVTADTGNELGGILVDSDGNEIGSKEFVDRNVLAGNAFGQIDIQGNANIVRGNLIGLGPEGSTAVYNASTSRGVLVDGDDNIIGGAVVGGRNVISNNNSNGLEIEGDENIVRRNYIGTDVTGAFAVSNDYRGILVVSGQGNVIGGRFNGGDNIISGNRADAIYVSATATGTIIRRNKIGVGVGEVPIPNAQGGSNRAIYVRGNGTQIGGGQAGDGNDIRFNHGAAIVVDGDAVGVTMRRNRIQDNINEFTSADPYLAVDLGDDGVTLNDLGDVDVGPNGLQNYPDISDINILGGDMIVGGAIDGLPNATYTIDFYRVSEPGFYGHGDAEEWLRAITVTTSNIGTGNFTEIFDPPLAEGDYLTSMATGPDGSTSEFSPTLEVVGLKVVSDNDSGYGSLRRAIEFANANPGVDQIRFGTGVTVNLLSPLPPITDEVRLGNFEAGSRQAVTISGAGLVPGGTLLRVQADGTRIEDLTFVDVPLSVCMRIDADDVLVDNVYMLDSPGSFGVLVAGNDNTVESFQAEDGASTAIVVEGDRNFVERGYLRGLTGTALIVRDGATDTTIQGVTFGNAFHDYWMNAGWGVLLDGAGPGTIIGSTGSIVAENDFGGNGQGGIGISSDSGSTAILRNTFDRNGGLAIDLGLDGVTLNDSGDVDTGPNDLQNFPELSYAYPSDGCVTVYGIVRTAANVDVEVHLYADDELDPSGHGEGRRYLGSVSTTTGSAGSATFNLCSDQAGLGDFVTATATVDGKTSEMAASIEVQDWLTVKTTSPNDLLQAMSIANQVPGPDTIRFDIPGTGPHRIRAFPIVLFDDTVIDGLSQPGSQPNGAQRNRANTAAPWIELEILDTAARRARRNPAVIEFAGSRSVLRGLVILAGDQDNPAIRIGGAGENRVEGCWVGVEADGSPWGSAATQIEILQGSTQNVIGGTALSDQNVIASATEVNVMVRSEGNRIEGNLIGLLPDGATAPGYTDDGVVFAASAGANDLGGSVTAARNTISGHARYGVVIGGGSTTVAGNVIGTDVSGWNLVPNGSDGIRVSGTEAHTIGGDAASENRIVGNGGAGVRVLEPRSGTSAVAVLGNEIRDNQGLGIDLGGIGVTPNDSGDGLVDSPVVTDSFADAGGWHFNGTVSGTAGQTVTLEFFENQDCDASGYGEGETLVGTADIVLGAATQSFDVLVPGLVVERLVAATATIDGATSEFSNCSQATATRADAPATAVTRLHRNVPNPFNPRTEIRFDLARSGPVRVDVFDARGRRVRTLLDAEDLAVGAHAYTWDGRDRNGDAVASGVYRVVLRTAEVTRTTTMVLVR